MSLRSKVAAIAVAGGLVVLTVVGRAQIKNAAQCAGANAVMHNDPVIDALVNEADRLLVRNDFDKALENTKRYVEDHPDSPELADALGRVFYRRKDLTEAVKAFNQAIKLNPCSAQVHYEAWRVEATAGLYEQAQQQLEAAHALSPDWWLVYRLWTNTHATLPEGVTAVDPPHFGFYSRLMDCDGIRIRSAAVVNPTALPVACEHIRQMLAHIPNVRANMVARGAELHINGEDQHVTDLPENRERRGEKTETQPYYMENSHAKIDIDARAAATGGIYASCIETNLMHMAVDRWKMKGEMCVHEFAHDVMGAGLDKATRDQIEKGYRASMKKGLWKSVYASTNANEWWAELSMWYFGGQGDLERMPSPVLAPGPAALKEYDPDAFALVDRIYSGQKQPKVVHEHLLKPVPAPSGDMGSNGSTANVLIVNNSPVRMSVYWIDHNGRANEGGVAEPYDRRMFHDYMGGNLMVVDPRTGKRMIFSITDDESEIVVE